MTEKCEEMENLVTKYDSFNIHRLRKLRKYSKGRTPSLLMDDNNMIVIAEE